MDMMVTTMRMKVLLNSVGISPLLSRLMHTLITRTASNASIAADIFTETGHAIAETIAVRTQVTVPATRIGTARTAEIAWIMRMTCAKTATSASRNAATVTTNVRAAAKNAILFATVAKKNAANVPPMKCVLNAVNTARIVWIPCGAIPVRFV